jgi:hypothetical protein
MTLDFWARTSGTWINIVTVLLGTTLGLLLKGYLPLRMQRIITQGVALITLFIGLRMAESLVKVQAGRMDGIVLGLITLVVGGLLGEWWLLEDKLNRLGDWLKKRFRGEGSFTQGFVAASLLFCVGPMTLIGSLNNGLTGDSTLLTLKATMDGLAAIALTSSFGIGVGFSALVILFYQGGLSLAAGVLAQPLPDPSNAPQVLLVTGIGGVMILGLGLNLLEVAQVRVAAFLPALMLAPVIYLLAIRV